MAEKEGLLDMNNVSLPVANCNQFYILLNLARI
jgi:hypothetical protein